jgi:integrase
MAKAIKQSNGKWRCKANYINNGKYVNKSFTRDTKKEAEYAAAAFLMDFKHKSKPENKTIGELADIYLDSRSNLISPSTMRSYRIYSRTAFPEIMKMRAGLITQALYQAAVNEYAKGKAPKTVREAHSLLSKIFKENRVDIDVKAVMLPQKIKAEIKIPSTEEIKIILKEANKRDIYLPVLIAALLGLRRSEIFALTWGDINIENKNIRINKAVVRDEDNAHVVKTTKTQTSTRTLTDIPPQIIEALPSRGADDEKLFNINADTFSDRYRRIIKRLGFNYTFHSLRHYNASIMLIQGVPTKYAAERLGHCTEDMLKTVYQHTFPDMHKQYSQNITDYFMNSGI